MQAQCYFSDMTGRTMVTIPVENGSPMKIFFVCVSSMLRYLRDVNVEILEKDWHSVKSLPGDKQGS